VKSFPHALFSELEISKGAEKSVGGWLLGARARTSNRARPWKALVTAANHPTTLQARRNKAATAANKKPWIIKRRRIHSDFLFGAQGHHHTQLGSSRCQASAVLNISKRPEEFAITQHFDLAPHQPPAPPPREPSATTVCYQLRVSVIAPDISSR
jgi:hypothetical protein